MDLSLGSPQEYAIIVAVVASLTQNIKQTKINNQYLPWVSMLIGAIAGAVAVVMTGDSNYTEGIIAGVIAGGQANGLFDGLKGIATKFKSNTGGENTNETK
ncbi:holin [Paucilactobacillus sp. N302-9]